MNQRPRSYFVCVPYETRTRSNTLKQSVSLARVSIRMYVYQCWKQFSDEES